MVDAGRFADAFSRLKKLKRERWGWKACCPAHPDKTQSLSVRIGDTGDLLLKCFAGCTFDEICNGLRIEKKDCYGERVSMSKEVAAYDYRDEAGSMLFQVVRFEPKDFRQRTPDGKGGWTWGLNGARRVLYRLPELVKGSKRTVILVEGEKDVDRLIKEGLLATCNPMGAGKWDAGYTESLKGRTVVAIPDNDKPGEEHIAAAVKAITPAVAQVVVLRLEGLPDNGDVSDWLNAGHTADELKQLCKDALAGKAAKPKEQPASVRQFVAMARSMDRRTRWIAVRELMAELEIDELDKP